MLFLYSHLRYFYLLRYLLFSFTMKPGKKKISLTKKRSEAFLWCKRNVVFYWHCRYLATLEAFRKLLNFAVVDFFWYRKEIKVQFSHHKKAERFRCAIRKRAVKIPLTRPFHVNLSTPFPTYVNVQSNLKKYARKISTMIEQCDFNVNTKPRSKNSENSIFSRNRKVQKSEIEFAEK